MLDYCYLKIIKNEIKLVILPEHNESTLFICKCKLSLKCYVTSLIVFYGQMFRLESACFCSLPQPSSAHKTRCD